MNKSRFRTLPLFGAMAVALLLPTGAIAADDYLCYQAKSSKNPAQSKFVGVEINAKDQFQPSGRNYLASKFTELCNPTTGAANPTVHQVELAVKDSKVNLNPSKFVKPTTVYSLTDAYVTSLPVTIVKPKSVRVRNSKKDFGPITKCKDNSVCTGGDTCQNGLCLPADITPGAPPAATPVDNFTCYQVKLATKTKPVLPLNVAFTDQFGNFGNYDLKKLTKLCAPADKDGDNPGAEGNAGHYTCYQAKAVKGATKFAQRNAVVNSTNIGSQYLDVKKVTEVCVPATKSAGGATPTTLTLTSQNPGGVCGALTTNMAGEGVPLRRDPANASADPNAVCTGAGAPKPCCTGAGAGHCDERTSVVCGSLSFGGGGAAVGMPGGESVNAGGAATRYSLSCASPTDTACGISGNAGDRPNGINCSTTGCGLTTPIDNTSPVKVCAVTTLGSPASGSLNLQTGDISLNNTASAKVYILTSTSFTSTACPRCRTTTATTSPQVFQTGPGTPGIGVCDSDATNPGTQCFVFEPAGDNAGLSAQCVPDSSGGGSASITINTTSTTAGDSVSDPAGHFCPGQAGNADCTGAGAPNPCCSGAGMGSCNNFNGCFGSGKFADTPALCTGISVTGDAPGALVAGGAPLPGNFGDVACIPAVASGSPVLDGLVNNNAGLPGPVVTSTSVFFEVD